MLKAWTFFRLARAETREEIIFPHNGFLRRFSCLLHSSFRYMTRKVALCLMAMGWIMGFTIATIPVIWNKWENALECEFDQIFYPWYMVGVITPVFSLVWFCMLFVYCRIWREASKQVKQLRTTGQQEGTSDWKSVQVRKRHNGIAILQSHCIWKLLCSISVKPFPSNQPGVLEACMSNNRKNL